jgi:hypothetical protein
MRQVVLYELLSLGGIAGASKRGEDYSQRARRWSEHHRALADTRPSRPRSELA